MSKKEPIENEEDKKVKEAQLLLEQKEQANLRACFEEVYQVLQKYGYRDFNINNQLGLTR